jgi:uncharacterized protein (TIGR03435 family)
MVLAVPTRLSLLLGGVVGLAAAGLLFADAQPAATPRFDVASIKPCQPTDSAAGGRGGPGTERGPDPGLPEGVGGYFRTSPGRLDVTCGSLLTMIGFAYIAHGRPLLNAPAGPLHFPESVKGIPRWALRARYTIHAETDNPAAVQPTRTGKGPGSRESAAGALLAGPMLQRLLEDRFQLKIHWVTEQAPMYALTVAKGGLKLKPMKDGDCIPGAPPRWPPGGKPPCQWIGWDTNGPNRRLLLGGVTLNRLAGALAELILDRNVLDRTGISSSFVTRLEYAPDENTRCIGPGPLCDVDATSAIPPAATIFSALEGQLGLKLAPIKGPKEHIVIDRVEPPSEN